MEFGIKNGLFFELLLQRWDGCYDASSELSVGGLCGYLPWKCLQMTFIPQSKGRLAC